MLFMAKTKASAKKKTTKKSTKAVPARKPGLAKTKPPKFYSEAGRGSRGTPRKQFHVLLSESEHKKLSELTFKMKMNAAAVFRALLERA